VAGQFEEIIVVGEMDGHHRARIRAIHADDVEVLLKAKQQFPLSLCLLFRLRNIRCRMISVIVTRNWPA
jgi:hypothetical protein